MTYDQLTAIAFGMACLYRQQSGDAFATASEFERMREDYYQAFEVVRADVVAATGYDLERGGIVVDVWLQQGRDRIVESLGAFNRR